MKRILILSLLTAGISATHAQRHSTDDLVAATAIPVAKSARVVPIEPAGGAALSYAVTTNGTDPSCDTGFTGYVNLEGFGILAQSTIIGDDAAFTAFSGQNPARFYGADFMGLTFSTDGVVHFGTPTFAPNTGLPDATTPNGIIAMMWADLEVVYDMAQNFGVSIATAGADTSIIEFDDAQFGGVSVGDFEIVFNHSVDNAPGNPEIIIAFDNVGTLPSSVTVGVEDTTASDGTQFLFGDPAMTITSGLIVCFDAVGDTPVDLMEFQVD